MTEKTVAFDDAFFQRGFVQMPNAMLFSTEIDPGAKIAFAALMHYAWAVDDDWPGQDEMAVRIGISERSLRTYLKNLQALGWLEIKRRGQGLTNLYRLVLPVQAAGLFVPERQQLPVPVERVKTELKDPSVEAAIEKVWDHFVAVADPRTKTLDESRRKMLRAALKVAGDAELLIQAIDGLAAYVKRRTTRDKSMSLSRIFKTRPNGDTLIEQIEWWASQAPAKAAVTEDGIPVGVKSTFAAMVRLYESRGIADEWEAAMSRLADDVFDDGWRVIFDGNWQPLRLERR